jgi:hypothetical protein
MLQAGTVDVCHGGVALPTLKQRVMRLLRLCSAGFGFRCGYREQMVMCEALPHLLVPPEPATCCVHLCCVEEAAV